MVETAIARCGHCGAPLSGDPGETVRCRYCGQAGRVPVLERHEPTFTPEEEAAAEERRRLRALLQQKVEPNDGLSWPERLCVLLVFPWLPGGAGRWFARRQRERALEQLKSAGDAWSPRGVLRGRAERRLRRWTLDVASAELDQPAGGKGAELMLEALALIKAPDERDWLRANLALFEVYQGNLRRAEELLSQCTYPNQHPCVEWSYRLAQATLALAQKDPARTARWVGDDESPLATPLFVRVEVAVLSAAAVELSGDARRASRILRAAIPRWFFARTMLSKARRLAKRMESMGLCRESYAALRLATPGIHFVWLLHWVVALALFAGILFLFAQ